MATGSGECTMLVMLDLSAVFDTLDHNVLMDRRNRLGRNFRVSHSLSLLLVLETDLSQWPLFFFLTGTACLSCGISQGFISSPMLFTLYLLSLGSIKVFPITVMEITISCMSPLRLRTCWNYTDSTHVELEMAANAFMTSHVSVKLLSTINS